MILTRPIPKMDSVIVAASYYYFALKLNKLTVTFSILIELFQTAGQYGWMFGNENKNVVNSEMMVD
jgi:hypothetical protein